MLKQLINEFENLKDEQRSINSARYFKTGEGQYGEGDKFYGITVPSQRELVKKYYKSVNLDDIKELLQNEYHEQRLTGLLILVQKFNTGSDLDKKNIFDFYLQNINNINNWDLVDTSASYIVGNYLYDKDRSILYKLANSTNLWEKRISIISTFYFIANKDFKDSINICKILMNDKHDLIHKATGWALREIGKKDINILTKFLDENVLKMPRTMLRYAIEKFDEDKRKYYLKIK